MKILTFNVGLLDYNVCCCTAFSNPPYSDSRLSYIPASILEHDPDIVAIQECYSVYHLDYLTNALKQTLPYRARKNNKQNSLCLHNGLIVFSKWQIIDSTLLSHLSVARVESFFGDKCSLFVTIQTKEYGTISLVNIHATAGGLNPVSNTAEKNREICFQEILQFCKSYVKQSNSVIVVGDLNCGPDHSQNASARNFEYMISAGNLRDTYKESFMTQHEQLHHNYLNYTWDTTNLLNKHGPHAFMPSQRLDHILLPNHDTRFGKVKSASIVFTEKMVPFPKSCFESSSSNSQSSDSENYLTISDHFGYLVEVEMLPSQSIESNLQIL